jgi:arylsulfatase
LPHPELYDLSTDPDESYDVAVEHPDIVAKITDKVAELIKGFPEPVQRAYAEAKQRKVNPATPAGAWARPAAQ